MVMIRSKVIWVKKRISRAGSVGLWKKWGFSQLYRIGSTSPFWTKQFYLTFTWIDQSLRGIYQSYLLALDNLLLSSRLLGSTTPLFRLTDPWVFSLFLLVLVHFAAKALIVIQNYFWHEINGLPFSWWVSKEMRRAA